MESLKAGNRVVARRKVESTIFHNTVVGLVLETCKNACRVICNEGTEIETDLQLFYSDWTFHILED